MSQTRVPVTSATTSDDARHRLIIVSYMANATFSPRGIRTQALLEHLKGRWRIELVAGATSRARGSHAANVRRSLYRRALRFAYSSVMLDKFEPSSRLRFRSWEPEAAGALLIGYPFSPLVHASRRLTERGIPYVVDAGDPWVLTADYPEFRGVARLRGLSAERRLWAGAAGAIVTTDSQAQALGTIFPNLKILVRPNGFAPGDQPAPPPVARLAGASDSILRLVHFGDISSDRLAVSSLLQGLARSGVWSGIEFHQYGSDWTGSLVRLEDVRVVFHEPRPWAKILAIASEYDLAVVVGNRDSRLLPSKAVVYLQLPIPRLAVIGTDTTSALALYVAEKPGWLMARPDDLGLAERIQNHLSRGWTASELAPPETESWDHVCTEIGQFLEAALIPRGSATPPLAAGSSRSDV
jgi:hypothetical protein